MTRRLARDWLKVNSSYLYWLKVNSSCPGFPPLTLIPLIARYPINLGWFDMIIRINPLRLVFWSINDRDINDRDHQGKDTGASIIDRDNQAVDKQVSTWLSPLSINKLVDPPWSSSIQGGSEGVREGVTSTQLETALHACAYFTSFNPFAVTIHTHFRHHTHTHSIFVHTNTWRKVYKSSYCLVRVVPLRWFHLPQ